MNLNPTLKVISYSKSQSLDMVMKNIRETGTIIRKTSIVNEKNKSEVVNKDKFNILMRKCISDMKKKIDKNHKLKQDPLDKINYDKQLQEIEILIDIIKNTGDVPQKQNHTPIVHVPLPKVSFRNVSKNHHTRVSSSRRKIFKENAHQYVSLDMGYDHHSVIPKNLQNRLITKKTLEKYNDKKSTTKLKEKQRVDVGTSMSSRPKSTVDKATVTTQKSTSNTQLDNLILENKRDITEELVLTLEKELNKIQKTENVQMVETEKPEKDEDESNYYPPLREMSTIASCSPRDNRLVPSDSFEVVSDRKGFPEVVDANDLYVVGNGWTVIDLPKDPLENSVVVKLNTTTSIQSLSSDCLNYKSKIDGNYNSFPKYNDKCTNCTNDTQSKENTDRKITFDEKFQIIKDKKEKSYLETQESLEEYHPNQPPKLDLTPAHKYNKKLSHILGLNANWNNIDMELQKDFNNFEGSLYIKTSSEDGTIERIDANKLVKQENKIKHEDSVKFQPVVIVQNDKLDNKDDNDKENVNEFKEIKQNKDSEDEVKQKKITKISKELELYDKEDKEQEHQNNKKESIENGVIEKDSGETKKEEINQKDIKPKRRISKSQKRSKKKVPEVHLSDYKGFYVVHTTNDWSFS